MSISYLERKGNIGDNSYMIVIKNLFYSYNKMPILQKINIRIPKAKIISLIGPNGAGKSTLLKCCLGLLTPQKGEILIDKKEISKESRVKIAKKMAYVPQKININFPISVFDFVLTGRRPHINGIIPGKIDLEKTFNILKELDIDKISHIDMKYLSGGEVQKTFIARAMVQEPDYLILDEATSNLDIYHQIDIMEKIKQLTKKRHIGVFMAIHDINLALKYSDEIIMLKKGTIQASGTPNQVINKENISKVYNIIPEIIKQNGEIYVHTKRTKQAV